MGLFDFFKRGGSTDTSERTLNRHGERVMDKRAMSPDRFASIEYLCNVATPEAWRAVLQRFNFTIDPSITDREEKQYIVESVKGHEESALEPVREYLRTAPSLTWPVKMLRSLVTEEELVAELLDVLSSFDTGYEKNSDRKILLLGALEEIRDDRICAAVLPFLKDFSEDVVFHSVRAAVAQGDIAALDPLLDLLETTDSMRLRSTVVDGIAEAGWQIPADKIPRVEPKVRSVPNGPWRIGPDGKVARG